MTTTQQRRPTDELICEVGDQIELAATFENDDDPPVATDPTKIFCAIRLPDDSVLFSTYGEAGANITKAGVGVYLRQFTPIDPGRYYWRFWGEGGVSRAHVGTLLVLHDPTRANPIGETEADLGEITLLATGTVS